MCLSERERVRESECVRETPARTHKHTETYLHRETPARTHKYTQTYLHIYICLGLGMCLQMLQIGFLVVPVPYWDWDKLSAVKSEEDSTQVH